MNHHLTFRKAQFDDWQMLLDWRNDPITRQNSLNSSVLTEVDHKSWLKNSLANPKRAIWIAMIQQSQQSTPFATMRCDQFTEHKIIKKYHLEESTQELSWTLSPDFRGRGLGSAMLKAFCDQQEQTYVARIKKNNAASVRMVEKCGFQPFAEQNGIIFYKNLELKSSNAP